MADIDVSEIRGRYGRIADDLAERVDRLTDEDWAKRTPCDEWDTQALFEHVVGVHRMVAAMISGGTPAGEPDTDLVASWRTARAEIESALADEARALQVVDTQIFGTMPFAVVVGGILCVDTLTHTWDLSRATGQDERLDPAGVAAGFALLKGLGDGIRGPGRFAPAVEPPPGADEQTQFLCFAGRAV